MAAQGDHNNMIAQEQIEEEAFKNMYISKRLPEVINYERGINNAKEPDTEDLASKKIAGFKEGLSAADKPDILQDEAAKLQENDVNEVEEPNSESESEEEGEEAKKQHKNFARPRNESPNSKKLRKKAVKMAQAEKRKNKTKKHIKKRRDKGTGKR